MKLVHLMRVCSLISIGALAGLRVTIYIFNLPARSLGLLGVPCGCVSGPQWFPANGHSALRCSQPLLASLRMGGTHVEHGASHAVKASPHTGGFAVWSSAGMHSMTVLPF